MLGTILILAGMLNAARADTWISRMRFGRAARIAA
jgi:hypothetical protein